MSARCLDIASMFSSGVFGVEEDATQRFLPKEDTRLLCGTIYRVALESVQDKIVSGIFF